MDKGCVSFEDILYIVCWAFIFIERPSEIVDQVKFASPNYCSHKNWCLQGVSGCGFSKHCSVLFYIGKLRSSCVIWHSVFERIWLQFSFPSDKCDAFQVTNVINYEMNKNHLNVIPYPIICNPIFPIFGKLKLF